MLVRKLIGNESQLRFQIVRSTVISKAKHARRGGVPTIFELVVPTPSAAEESALSAEEGICNIMRTRETASRLHTANVSRSRFWFGKKLSRTCHHPMTQSLPTFYGAQTQA